MDTLEEGTELPKATVTAKGVHDTRRDSHDTLAGGEHRHEVDNDEACGLKVSTIQR